MLGPFMAGFASACSGCLVASVLTAGGDALVFAVVCVDEAHEAFERGSRGIL